MLSTFPPTSRCLYQGDCSLSGVYDARFFVGDYYNDDAIYQNSPVDYILESERRLVY